MHRTILLLLCIAVLVISTAGSAQTTSPNGKNVDSVNSTNKDGALVVNVTWGDIGNTPANDVYVEAYGFVSRYRAEKSFVLKMSHDGEYKAPLPPGIYDVFVSEGGSVPRCRRVQVREGLTIYWTLKLEIDDVYSNRSSGK